MKRNMAEMVEADGVVCSGEILQREAYSYGRWHSRWACISGNTMFICMEEGGAVTCALPLKGGHIDKYPVNCNRDEGIKEVRVVGGVRGEGCEGARREG